MPIAPAGPEWFEPALPSAEQCSIGSVLARRAATDPNEVLVVFDSRLTWTTREAYEAACKMAAALRRSGVKRGDHVAVWQPNGPNMLSAIFACSMLGAAACQINVAFRGGMLAHALGISNARVLISHGELIERLDGVDVATLEVILATQAHAMRRSDLELVPYDPPGWPAEPPPIELSNPWDLAALIFTSGTTGPSKGVRVTCGQMWTLGEAFYGFMGSADRMLLALPMFHIASLGSLYGVMGAGASLAVMESFRPADFWTFVDHSRATAGIGAFMDFLLKAPPSEDDRRHTMRRMLVQSTNSTVRAFSERFGVEVYAGYSMSETSVISISEVNPSKNRSVGRPRKGLEVRIVDEHDIEVPVGQPGELVVRSDLPWVLNDGYEGDPEATLRAWRNGWFHTGDQLVADADGDLFYVDRLKDAIRRRGENISSAEVEVEVRAFGPVRDAAAIGVATLEGEEVMIVVSPNEGATIDPAELIAFLVPRMPHYMIPRFVRVCSDLPRTETNKVQKPGLRAAGITPDTWDREASGIKIRRQRLAT
jgi:crotonobetaine/carnitine-CoA ligase